MERYPHVQLSHIRQIGWTEWNPLGLCLPDKQAWRHVNIAEYDNHLMHVVCLLTKGSPRSDAVAYLEQVAREYPPPAGSNTDRHHAAVRTVRAIADYLRSVRS